MIGMIAKVHKWSMAVDVVMGSMTVDVIMWSVIIWGMRIIIIKCSVIIWGMRIRIGMRGMTIITIRRAIVKWSVPKCAGMLMCSSGVRMGPRSLTKISRRACIIIMRCI
jgi:hypothetical protein